MEEDKIHRIILEFPHGLDSEKANFIARKVEGVVKAGISEGGMQMLTNPFGGEEMKFSEDTMHFSYGHKRDKNNGC